MESLKHISFIGFAGPCGLLGAGSSARPGRLHAPEPPLDPLAGWMLDRAGLRADIYRASAMHRRLPACLRRLRVSTAAEACSLLDRRPDLLGAALDSLLIGVSGFFRDTRVFDYIAASVVPDLLKNHHRPRVCSVGVSAGQELYSMGMLMDEAGGLDRTEFTGVDCRPEAVRRAEEGWFTASEMEGVDEGRRGRYFSPEGNGWRIGARLRNRMRWLEADATSLAPAPARELIFFRNVTLYFRPPHGDNAWRRLCDMLSPGGWIVTGKAERPPGDLPLRRMAPCVYRKLPPC